MNKCLKVSEWFYARIKNETIKHGDTSSLLGGTLWEELSCHPLKHRDQRAILTETFIIKLSVCNVRALKSTFYYFFTIATVSDHSLIKSFIFHSANDLPTVASVGARNWNNKRWSRNGVIIDLLASQSMRDKWENNMFWGQFGDWKWTQSDKQHNISYYNGFKR